MAKLIRKYKKEAFTIALIAMGFLVYFGIQSVQATAIEDEKDTLSTSAPSTLSDHEIWFTRTDAWAADATLVIEIDEDGTAFTIPAALDYTDIDLSYGTNGTETEAVLYSSSGVSTWAVEINSTTDEFTFILPSSGDVPSASDKVMVEIGDNATGGSGNEQITNPAKSAAAGTADIYKIGIDYASATDTGRALIAIIDGVTVTATVQETLTFSIANVAGATCDTDFGDDSDATVTNTSVAFGALTVDTFTHGCQDLAVGTNAPSGYTVTSQENSWLTSASGNTIIDTQCDSSCSESSGATWTSGSNYGFGHSCKDQTGTSCNSAYTNTDTYRQFANIEDSSETAQSIMTNTSAPATITERSTVEYKISVGSTQQTGDYSNTITYIATPNY